MCVARTWGGTLELVLAVHLLFSPFLLTPLSWPPKRKYNAVSAIADEIWQYRTGGTLTIFDKDQDTAKEGRSRTASGSVGRGVGHSGSTGQSATRT